MARIKRSIVQRDMSAGELREDFLERDDVEMRSKSLKTAENVKILATGAVEARPGTWFKTAAAAARQIREIEPADGETYALVIYDTQLKVLAEDGTVVFTQSSVNWTDGSLVSIMPYGEKTLLLARSNGIFLLEYNGTSWAYGAFSFDAGSGNSLVQPYWNFFKGSKIITTGTTGSVTVTADTPVFKTTHVGTRIRYAGKEILITAFTSTTVVVGTVQDNLPPTFGIDVASTIPFRVGDVVIGQESGFQGVIVLIIPPKLYVLTLENETGPTLSEPLTGPTATQDVVAIASAAPAYTTYWDEQLMSPARNYPRSAAVAAGRLFFVDFPNEPSLIAASSVRSIGDFATGAADDDAILRTVGSDKPRFRHVMNAGDLLFLSSKGSYFQNLRDGNILSPSTFAPIGFDSRACANVPPVAVDGGVVFVEQGNRKISAALLDGNIYLKWSVKDMATYHDQTIGGVVSLCGPPLSSEQAEKYLFAVNDDGTVAAVSWRQDFGQEAIGFVRWNTQGSFLRISPIFRDYWAITDRTIGSSVARSIEVFSDDALLDCASEGNPNLAGEASHLVGATATVAWEGRFAGTGVVAGDGSVGGMSDVTSANAQIGFNFIATAAPWPAELTDSERIGTIDVRVFHLFASVQHTGPFQMRCNAHTREVGGYAFGEILSDPPPLRTQIYRAPVFGIRAHPDLALIKHLPTKWRVLAIGQEVQG
jgi:hypothetical protein